MSRQTYATISMDFVVFYYNNRFACVSNGHECVYKIKISRNFAKSIAKLLFLWYNFVVDSVNIFLITKFCMENQCE